MSEAVNTASKALKVTARQHYGSTHVYPACAASRLFVAIQGGKTLTPKTIETLKAAGFTLEVLAEPVKL